MTSRLLVLAALLAGTIAEPLKAAVSPEQAALLGTTLTPVGAERAGNRDGGIPAWSGGLPRDAGQVDAAGHRSDPFANEQPLFTITADDLERYRYRLSAGQRAMLQRYPASFRMTVYPSHRSASLPESVNRAIAANATRARLGRDVPENVSTAIPFPLPRSGAEAVWNSLMRYRGGSLRRDMVQVSPLASGEFLPVGVHQQLAYREPAAAEDVFLSYVQTITAPARLAGNAALVHETLGQTRRMWVYFAGQRRVRRAPQEASPGSQGLRLADDLEFIGAPKRYRWTLRGKRELYIPYNAFKLESPRFTYADVLRKGHLNPELTRYELHRVWVVDGVLAPGERDIYSRRVLYLDEDTWQVVLSDNYDPGGTLWRVGEGFMTPLYDRQIPWLSVAALYDLADGRYAVSGLRNEVRTPMAFGVSSSAADYTPNALRIQGVR